MNSLAKILTFEFCGKVRPQAAGQFYLIQAFGFLLTAHVFVSWDFGSVGFAPDEIFDRPMRPLLYGYWVRPWFEIASFQFIYEFVERPSSGVLTALQYLVAGSALAGLFGVWPRLMAFLCLVFGAHLFGMFLVANSTMDGSASILMSTILVIAVTPGTCHYRLGKRMDWRQRDEKFHYPVFLMTLILAAYYFSAGLNKALDVGIDWPLHAGLDSFSQVAIEQAVFTANWYTYLPFSELLMNPEFALFSAYFVYIFELLSPLMLFFPVLIPVFLIPLSGFHACVYLSHGYGYFVISVVDLICALNGFLRWRTKNSSLERH